MRAARSVKSKASRWRPLKSLRRQLYREANLAARRKDNLRLQHLRMSSADWWSLLILIILVLLTMVLGAYIGDHFKGEIIEADSHVCHRAIE